MEKKVEYGKIKEPTPWEMRDDTIEIDIATVEDFVNAATVRDVTAMDQSIALFQTLLAARREKIKANWRKVNRKK